MSAVAAPHMKVICPTANTMPVTLNAGFRMPSWFDLTSLDVNASEDAAGIRAARDTVHGLIQKEVAAGIPAARIVVGGFSQGGGLALYAGLTHGAPLAGLVALSCWLPLRDEFPAAAAATAATPVLQCHGDCDPVVPYKFGQLTSGLLKKFLPNATFKSYPGVMHSSCDEEMAAIKSFLAEKLPPS